MVPLNCVLFHPWVSTVYSEYPSERILWKNTFFPLCWPWPLTSIYKNFQFSPKTYQYTKNQGRRSNRWTNRPTDWNLGNTYGCGVSQRSRSNVGQCSRPQGQRSGERSCPKGQEMLNIRADIKIKVVKVLNEEKSTIKRTCTNLKKRPHSGRDLTVGVLGSYEVI